jgi:hypothetical protein
MCGEAAARRDGRAVMKAAAAAAFGGGVAPKSHGETAARRNGRAATRLRGETAAWRLYGGRVNAYYCLVSSAAAARRDGCMARRPPARGGCAARRPRSNESSGRCSIRGRSLSYIHHRGDFGTGSCRMEDRGVGAVEGTEETFQALLSCGVGL